MRKEQGISIIDDFNGEFRFLSNFFPCLIHRGTDVIWNSTEAAFQAAKVKGQDHYKEFMAMSPAQSKKAGKNVKIREDWDDVKLGIMFHLVRDKFSQNMDLTVKLIETGDALLVEGNTWRDNFWGIHHEQNEVLPLSVIKASCLPCAGNNYLGRILMNVRFHLSLSNFSTIINKSRNEING